MWVLSVAADLLDEGIDDGAAPTGFLATDKHPVLHAELGWTDGSFGMIVIKLDTAVFKARFKVRPLVAGVLQRLAQGAFGQDTAVGFEMLEEFGEVVVYAAQ